LAGGGGSKATHQRSGNIKGVLDVGFAVG